MLNHALMPLAVWVHQMDPFALQLGPVPIRWYGLSYLVGFVVAWLLIRRVMRVGHSPLQPVQAGDLVMCLAIGAVVGGRLGYCTFYEPHLWSDFGGGFPFWGVLRVNQGGMASHGGMLGVIVAAVWFARKNKVSLAHLFDLAAFGAPLGLLFGRLANFVNGELYGRACDPSVPWAVKFPQELQEEPLSPALLDQLQPAAETMGIRGSQWTAWIQDAYFGAGDSAKEAWGQLQTSVHQMVLAVQDNPALAKAMAPALTARHPSQLYAGLTEGVVTMLVLLWVWRKPQKPMLVGGCFALVYAAMRVFNEHFRLPDAQFIAEDGTLPTITRGQWLSLGLVAFGVFAIVWSWKSKSPRLGSWRSAPAPGTTPGKASGSDVTVEGPAALDAKPAGKE